MTKNINWETYLEDFPDRYIKPGLFDKKLKDILADILKKKPSPIDALDVGGGRIGTEMLNRTCIRTWLADPFIHSCPEWMQGNICHLNGTISIYLLPETTYQRFDIIVARGSYNYLDLAEIYAIGELLKPGGIFFFNTFVEAKTGERQYINSKTGQKGIEKYQIENNTIRHWLIPEIGNTIEHTFNIYNRDRIELAMAGARLEAKYEQNGNSLYVTATKN